MTVSDERLYGRALGARLAQGDRGAAAPALNLMETRTPKLARQQAAALLSEVSPAKLGGEAPAHIVGVTGPPGGRGSLPLLSLPGESVALARRLGCGAGGRSEFQTLRWLAPG